MLVHQILKEKSDDAVVTVSPRAQIVEVIEVLSSRRIGAVVVSKDGEVAEGIVSERDIVRELGRRGAACLQDSAANLMTAKLITCGLDETADDVLIKMTEGRFRHLPVVEQGLMVGLISIGDVVKARLSELSMEKDALEGMIMGY